MHIFLYKEYFVLNFVDMMDAHLVLPSDSNSLLSALQLEDLPVDFDVLPENRVHPKGELVWIVRQV